MQYFQLLSVTETRMSYGSIGPAIRGRLRLHLWHKVQSGTCLNHGSCKNLSNVSSQKLGKEGHKFACF